MIEVNTIQEIYKGHFQVILDFPSPVDLEKIINLNYKYVWAIEHKEVRTSWVEYDYSLFEKKVGESLVLARNIEMEFLIETDKYLKLIPHIKQTVKIIQTNIIPPSYIDIKRLNGKRKYDLLKEKINYLFELEMPGASDYSPIISPNREFLEEVIAKFRNNK
jgi:hypothetical protein